MTGSRHLALGKHQCNPIVRGNFSASRWRTCKANSYQWQPQLYMYALTLKQLTDRPVSDLVLLFIRTQQEVTWLWGDRARVMADELLIEIPGKVEADE